MLGRNDAEQSSEKILEQYERQHSRGVRGFGLIEVNAKGVRTRRSTEPVKALLDVSRAQSPVLLFHHRQPTGTDNTLEQTHPMWVEHDELRFNYLVMHNGVIHNAEERKKVHEETFGYTYLTYTGTNASTVGFQYRKTFNDSEAFAIDLCRTIEGLESKVLSRGAAAFMAVAIRKDTGVPERILWGTNGTNPLVLSVYKDMIQIASELVIGEDVSADHLYWIQTAHLFKKKGNLADAIMKEPLIFDRIVVEQTRTLPVIQTGKSYNWNEHNIPTSSSTAVKNVDDAGGPPDDETEAMTPRQKAFDTKFERIMDKIGDELYPLLGSNMAYEPLGENEVDAVLSDLKDIILEADRESIKIRDWMDRLEGTKEQDEMDGIFKHIGAADDGAPKVPANLPVHAELPGKPEFHVRNGIRD